MDPKGKLIAVIADEVSSSGKNDFELDWVCDFGPQDTCTGFLLGGIGEINNKREPNFLVVDKGL